MATELTGEGVSIGSQVGSSVLSGQGTFAAGPSLEYAPTQQRTIEEQAPIRRESAKPRVAPPPTATPSQRYALVVHQKEALEHAAKMEEAASDGDIYVLASEGVLLTESLSAMWRLRHLRSHQWGAIVNFLQGVVSRVEFENFSQDQCTALRMIVESNLRPDADDDDESAAVTILARAGFNPWRGIASEAQTRAE